MEEIKNMLQAILEGQQKLSAELQGFRKETDERFEEMGNRLDNLEAGQQETNRRLGQVENRLVRVESKITDVSESLGYVIQDVYLLKKKQG